MTLSTEITLQVVSKPNFSRRSLYLEENGKWPYFISFISFPSALSSKVHNDFRSLVDLDFMCGMNLSMKDVKDHNGNFISNKEYWIRGSKMKYEMGRKEKGLSAPRDGVDFWNRMIALLTYRLHSRLPIKASGII